MATYIQIGSTVTVGAGGAANIDFTSIPSTYTDLLIVGSLRTAKGGTSDSLFLRFNGSTSGYSDRNLQGTGSSVSSFSNAASTTSIYCGEIDGNSATASTFSNSCIYIPNYAGSTNKSTSTDNVGENNATAADALLCAGLWSNTAAITSINLRASSGNNFMQYTTASLYGISKS